MEVKIISRELIKPSSPTIQHHKPCSLSLLNQLIPTTYSPVIFFYPMTSNNANSTLTRTDQLKKSLSETLNLYYPLSGRVKGNHFIHDFSEGVPFFESRVNCSLSQFIKHLEIESLNHFLAFQPFTKELDAKTPLSAFQATTFSCGGMVIGWNASHKLVDGGTAKAISEYCNQLEELFSNETPDIFACTSWCYLGFTKANFGWGEPYWTGLMGKVGPAFRNLTVFIETKDGNGIEAWITLDEKKMRVLEQDPEFLALASPNPEMISML